MAAPACRLAHAYLAWDTGWRVSRDLHNSTSSRAGSVPGAQTLCKALDTEVVLRLLALLCLCFSLHSRGVAVYQLVPVMDTAMQRAEEPRRGCQQKAQ